MNRRFKSFLVAGVCVLSGTGILLLAARAASNLEIQRQPNGDVVLQVNAPAGQFSRIDASSNLQQWEPLATFRSTGVITHTDSAAPYFGQRFYRAADLSGTGILTGDHLVTADGEIVFHVINHASFVMGWNGKMIYNDPVGGAPPFQGFAKADLILVSHDHSDHYDNATLDAVRGPNVRIIAPQAVYNRMTATLKALTIVLANGASTPVMGVTIDAVPAYNLTNSNHPLGVGNGYILTIGGKRIYMSGDSEDIPEMRALTNIDVAFVCMNVPFTMSVTKAVSAVRAFRPRVIYPYHYRNQDSTFADLNGFKQQVGTDLGIEVRLRPWYGTAGAASLGAANSTRSARSFHHR
jgi:L-ascorbate metabolism protein UlaG (beta-lactamase superfamily)